MNPDKMIHPVKNFADLDDEDVTAFLRDRKFGSESSILEFKSAFPVDRNKSGAKEICKYIVGFLNAEGGVIVYGVSDRVSDPGVPFPDYVPGITEPPSPEKLSQWIKESICPPVDLPPMGVFNVAGRKVVILKIPPGDDKPYCYYDPRTHAVWYFMRTANSVAELAPDEIREFYRTFSGDTDTRAGIQAIKMATWKDRIKAHQGWVKTKLEDPQNFGFVGMYTAPARGVEIPLGVLSEFLERHRSHFSSELRRSGELERYQKGVSVGYFPRAIRQDIKSTYRTTLYTDGLVALDSQADPFMDSASMSRGKILHPYWLSYQLQRHLQLSRAVLDSWNVDGADLIVEFENIEDFSMGFQGSSSYVDTSPYSGFHSPIEMKVNLSEVYKYDGDRRNITMRAVQDIMEEVCRIFGNAQPPGLWDAKGYLTYVKGAENKR